MDRVKGKMSCLNFILPANFKFSLKRESFRGLVPRRKSMSTRDEESPAPINKKFVYCRAAMLE